MPVVQRIVRLKQNDSLSKHEHLVQGVIEAIDDNVLPIGHQLPSINNMVDEIGYARKTIFRAYEELKDRGLIESRKLKGYFVISQETNVTKRLALLLFAFQSFQEEFYNTFREEMGNRFQIDVFFHHNNVAIFKTILANIQGKYGMYVIAPIQHSSIKSLLKTIEPKKLLLVDRYLDLGVEYSFIAQEFEEAIYLSLVKLLPAITKYKKFILILNKDTDHSPPSIRRAFERFLVDYKIEGKVKNKYKLGSVKKDNLYFILSDTFLWDVLRDCEQKNYKIGQNIGILSQDDNVAKEIVFGGITTISTDFKEMARLTAQHVKFGDYTQIIIPTKLIKRNSL
ncbi:GntR family transcriptional regulator [Maribacter sp. HTCC2170]|uniref:GntR family transcriptional regulator n=1 Tax=Maribacter sp. (strain HTCC2170 / KCCM 42371) TaxID=313603 RepID=UPI00006BD29D|nr:GntR family transcriptional regulator [Maribacter sp. HTCC2170]EAR02560.1 FucR [Maribacter sp. HTCC2170]